ncbi:MAG: 3-dehydroquinate synthase II, partial [Clostridium sp.]
MNNNKELWFDARNLSEGDLEKCLPVVFNSFYRGVMIDTTVASIVEKFPVNTKVLIDIDNSEEEIVRELLEKYENKKIILYSREENWDAYSDLKDVELGAYSSIYDRESMDKCIELSGKFKSLIIEFKSATNIPLELVLAFSQKNNCFICKEIN